MSRVLNIQYYLKLIQNTRIGERKAVQKIGMVTWCILIGERSPLKEP
jgi:hypothetical protein